MSSKSRVALFAVAGILLSINIFGGVWLISHQPNDVPVLPTLAEIPQNDGVTIYTATTLPDTVEIPRPAPPVYAVESETWAREIESAQLQQVERRNEVSGNTVANQHILQFDNTLSDDDITAYVDSLGVQVVETLPELNRVVIIASDDNLTQLTSTEIVSTEPDYYASALFDIQPTDPFYDLQWNLNAVGAERLWSRLPDTPETVTVAVIDSGICYDHPDMPTQYTAFQYDYVEDDTVAQDVYGHGCGVAGVIVSQNNAIGTVGLAPFVEIMPLRVLDENGIGSYSDIARAIVDATDNGADIINLSLGGAQQSATLQSAVDYALAQDVILVAAAGNSNGNTPLYPARHDGVLAVGSVNQEGAVSEYNHLGVELYAPGDGIIVPHIDNDTIVANGTSIAAPHVSGVIALKIAAGLPYSATDSVLIAPPNIITVQSETTDDPEGPLVVGDILIPREYVTEGDEANALFTFGFYAFSWFEGKVYYAFDDDVSELNRERTRVAMDHWEATANIEFIPRTTERNYLYIQNSNVNTSYVGVVGGAQEFNITSWEYRYVIVHELGHALGLWHEQSRNDRDDYVTVHYDRIMSGAANNFEILPQAYTIGTYDYASVMHYFDTAFSTNGQPTITINNSVDRARWQDLMGQYGWMSELDAIGMWVAYPCDPDYISLDCIDLPENDIVDDALFVDTLEYSHSITGGYGTQFATTSVDDPFPSCAYEDSGKTLWYKFSLPSSKVTVSTFGSTYDTVLSVWTGERGNFTEVACNRDANRSLTSELSFIPQDGETYYIQVAGEFWWGVTEAGGGNLYFNLSADPVCLFWDDWNNDPDIPACPPIDPDNLYADSILYDEKIDLTWRDNSTSETLFAIERSPFLADTWTQIDVVPMNVTVYSDTSVDCHTSYDYRVLAHRADDGQYSDPTNVASVTSSCSTVAPPSNLWRNPATRNANQIGWLDNSVDETSFIIERSLTGEDAWELAGEEPANSDRFVDDDPDDIFCGLTYDYRVRAYRAGDDFTSAPSNVVTDELECDDPADPSNVTVEPVITTRHLTISWQDNSQETAFFVERLDEGIGYTDVGDVGEDVTTLTDTTASLTCYTTYTYRVWANRNTDFKSSDWAYGSGMTSCETLVAPDGLAVTGNFDSIELDWTNNSPDGTQFHIERSLSGDNSWSEIGTSADTTYSDSTGICGYTYDYRVRHYRSDDAIYSGYSNIATSILDCTAPVQPETLTAQPVILTNDVMLMWVDNAFNETNYYVQRRPLGGGDWDNIAMLGADSTTYTDTDVTLSCYASYEYRVRAYRDTDGLYSQFTNVATTKTWCDPETIPSFFYNGSLATGDATNLSGFPYPTCGNNVTQVAVWEFIPIDSYVHTVDTVGSNIDTVLAVIHDNGSLTQLSCNDNANPNGISATAVQLTAGQRYLIVAGGKNGASGNISLNLARRIPDTPTFVPTVTPLPTQTQTPNTSTVGLYSGGVWYFRDSNNSGSVDVEIRYGVGLGSGWLPVVGDWNGDGVDGIGLYKDGRWRLRDMTNNQLTNEYIISFGSNEAGWIPVVGDWDGDGDDGLGLYKDGQWLLKRNPSDGSADYAFLFNHGDSNAQPIAGDWFDQSADRVGLYSAGIWFLATDLRTNTSRQIINFGPANNAWQAVVGDWDEDGDDTVGVFNGGQWRLRNTNSSGSANLGFTFNLNNAIPLSGYRGGATALNALAAAPDINTLTEPAQPSATLEPTLTAFPTLTPMPTQTTLPTETATYTPTPTYTSSPTQTPVPVDPPDSISGTE